MRRLLILGLCTAMVGACTDHAKITSARIIRISDEEFELKLYVPARDLRDIAILEMPSSAVLFGCVNGFDFTVEPELNGVRVIHYDRTLANLAGKDGDEPVEIAGRLPASIVSQMGDTLCARLQGGNMIGHVLTSEAVRVSRD